MATTQLLNGNSLPSPSSDEDVLFSSDLISPSVEAALPEHYSMRSLARSDYDRGFLDVLRVLTKVGDITRDEFNARFDQMRALTGYQILVILDGSEKIVGTGALVVERKL